jgi:excisionase family DNA binding protein
MNMSRLSVAQAAEHLGVSPARVRQRIDDGSLVAEKIGGRWLVDLDASHRAPAQLGRPVSPASVWWSLASAEVAQGAVPDSEAKAAASYLQAVNESVPPAVDVSALQSPMKPDPDAGAISQSLLQRMRQAENRLASLRDAIDAAPVPSGRSCAPSSIGHADLLDRVGPRFVAEMRKPSRSSRNRAVHRLADAVEERDHDGLLAWLSNRASRRDYVAAGADLAALREDGRLVASGVSHPDSSLDDPQLFEGYVRADDLDDLVSGYWLERPAVDERPNVVLHVAPIRPSQIGPMLLAADLYEHGGPREVQRAHELLDVAIDALTSADETQARQ